MRPLQIIQKGGNALGNGAVFGVRAGLKITVHSGEDIVVALHSHHSAVINIPAIPGKKRFSFHRYLNLL